MDVNNFLQSEATQFVGTAAANTIGLVIGTIHEDIKELLEIPDEYQAISILSVTKDVHVIRDATRGGVGTVLYEIAEQSKTGIRLNAEAIPVQDSVKGVCGMLGLEPLYLACEGRLVIFAPKENAEAIVAKLREGKYYW